MDKMKYIFLGLVVSVFNNAHEACCNREPNLEHSSHAKQAGGNSFQKIITTELESYMPGKNCTELNRSSANGASSSQILESQILNKEVNHPLENNPSNAHKNKRHASLNKMFFTNNKNGKIGILQADSTGRRKAGDAYIGTTGGLYLKYVGTHNVKKIKGINEPVNSIHIDYDGGLFVTTADGKLYYISHNGDNEQGVQGYVPNPVLSIGGLQKMSFGSRQAGDIYIGTTEGVYLKYTGTQTIKKINGIDEPVTAINIDFNGGVYVITSTGKLYYIDTNGNNYQGIQSYIPDQVLVVAVLEKKSSGTRQAGDIYVGTTKGVYLKYVLTHTIKKISGIDEAVSAIEIDFNGGAYVTTSTGKLYYIDPNGNNCQGLQSYIPGKVLSIGVLKKKSSGARQAGDIYIGTTDGVYLKYVGTHNIMRIVGINEPVTSIFIDFNGGAFPVTSTGKLYYINMNGENNQGIQDYIPDKIL